MKVELKKGEDNSLNCNRKALGNVTNQLGKRRFSSIPTGSCSKSRDGDSENMELNVGKKSSGVKRVRVSPDPCNEIENVTGSPLKLDNEHKDPNLIDSSKEDGDECKNPGLVNLINDDSVTKSDDLREIHVSEVSKILGEDEDPNLLEVSSGVEANTTQDIVIHNNASELNCVNLGENYDLVEVLANNQSDHEGDFQGGGEDCVMSQTGSIDFSRLLDSQESRCFGLERCTTLDSNAAIDMIKACTCSFCAKAAYIWTDLHYQDYKGRLATIKKSEKEASVLVERSCRGLGNEKHGVRNPLEAELMGQWRSLFVHMENIFQREGTSIEESLIPLKDLREKCKTDLELLNRQHK